MRKRSVLLVLATAAWACGSQGPTTLPARPEVSAKPETRTALAKRMLDKEVAILRAGGDCAHVAAALQSHADEDSEALVGLMSQGTSEADTAPLQALMRSRVPEIEPLVDALAARCPNDALLAAAVMRTLLNPFMPGATRPDVSARPPAAVASAVGPIAAASASASAVAPGPPLPAGTTVALRWVLERTAPGSDGFELFVVTSMNGKESKQTVGHSVAAEDGGPNGPAACKPGPAGTVIDLSCVHGPAVIYFRAALEQSDVVVTEWGENIGVAKPAEFARIRISPSGSTAIVSATPPPWP